MTDTQTSARFVRDAHALVRDLLAVHLRRYWTDFLTTIAIAYTAFAVYLLTKPASVAHVTALVVAGLAMYRAVVFTHEITHRRESAFTPFRAVWNLLCGIPFLMPSFMYGDHKTHHASHTYGTWTDPEYIVHGAGRRIRIGLFLLLPVVYPLMVVVRFLLLTPLALLSRRMDRLVWTYASSLYVMNETYRREYDAAARAPSRWLQEVACSAWAWFVVYLTAAGYIGWQTLAQTYLLFLFWAEVNQVRTLVAHRYVSNADEPVSYLDQLLDTNTFPRGRLLPELWAPVGLRYHALHHLLPMLPYHAAREAHLRLMRQLPADSPYHQTIRSGLWPALLSVLLDRERRPALAHSAVAAIPLEDRPGSR
jgi:fatty acid desaturase